jgi:hypothetical protein
MSSKRLQCAAIAIAVVLAACSNGSGSLTEPAPPTSPGQVTPPPTTTPETPTPPTPPPPVEPPPTPPPPTPAPTSAIAGYWYGTVKPKGGSQLVSRAMIAANGDAQIIVMGTTGLTAAPEFVIYGNVCCESKLDLDLPSKRYLNDRESSAKVQLELKEHLAGKIKIRADEYEVSLDRLARYDETVTMAELAGTYSRTITVFLGPSSTYTMTLDPSGRLTGSHTNGCVYNGTATLPDAPRNLLKLSVELSNCPTSITGSGSWNGTYTGMGVLFKDATAPSNPTQRTDILFHSFIGPTWLGPQPTER